MKINKQIIINEPMDIKIDEITLLSVEEYERCNKHIKPIDDWWWLRSPGFDSSDAAEVDYDGDINKFGSNVDRDYEAVRPVVVLRLNPESGNLQIGDKLDFAGHVWTMIADNMALCDEPVGQTCFREDWQSPDANDYMKSDVKKWLEQWAKEKEIEVED